MGDPSRKIEVDKLFSYSDDLVQLLKKQNDFNNFSQCLDQSNALRFQCDTDYNDLLFSLQDYQKKIDVCKHKTDLAKSEAATDAEIDLLKKELEELFQRESLLRDELRAISNDINDLEHQRVSVEERRKILKKLEQDDRKAEMKLSMFASITNIIPNLDVHSQISGHMVERDKKAVDKFELDPVKMTAFDMCNNIWEMINL